MGIEEIKPEDKRESRRQRGFKWESEVTIRSKEGFPPGRTPDISESGISALLPVELQAGQTVELKIKLPRVVAETIEKVEKLACELRAINHWDAEYRRHRRRDRYEKVAFVSRQTRRSEVITQMLTALLQVAKG
jgi:hypothetical protein